jgi:D-beta-D-heptose 7-phosphate kinase/D-beta-D-heptose 1-phosphate adenosyltransferase
VDTSSKVVSLNVLNKKIAMFRRQGKQIALTNGCFDVFHFGHASYLEKAKKPNRILVVALNSDKSIQRIKGPQRPIIMQKYRAGLLAALACVDFVTIFNEDTPIKVVKAIKPDILIKGADWKGKPVVGKDIVEQHGGTMEYIRFVPGLSSTSIIETINKRCHA